MDENYTAPARRPVRRRKTKMEIFKEAYLPYLILFAAAVLIVIFIIGALGRNSARKDAAGSTDALQTSLCQTLEC